MGVIGIVVACVGYVVAWGLESVRLRSGGCFLRESVGGIAAVSLFAHTLYLVDHFLLRDHHLVVSVGGWFFVLAWGLVGIWLALFVTYPKTPFGLFLLPLVFVTLGAGVFSADESFPVAATARTIRAVHGGSFLAAAIGLFLGGVAGVMDIFQSARLRSGGRFAIPVPLPSLEWLRRMERKSVAVSVLFLGLGILSGFYINHVQQSILGEISAPHEEGGASHLLLEGRKISGGRLVPTTDLMGAGAILLFAILLLGLFRQRKAGSEKSDPWLGRIAAIALLILAAILAVGIVAPRAHWRLLPNPTAVSPNLFDNPVERENPPPQSPRGTP